MSSSTRRTSGFVAGDVSQHITVGLNKAPRSLDASLEVLVQNPADKPAKGPPLGKENRRHEASARRDLHGGWGLPDMWSQRGRRRHIKNSRDASSQGTKATADFCRRRAMRRPTRPEAYRSGLRRTVPRSSTHCESPREAFLAAPAGAKCTKVSNWPAHTCRWDDGTQLSWSTWLLLHPHLVSSRQAPEFKR
jgi:hypothetical protein